jgi:hypothetical protein
MSGARQFSLKWQNPGAKVPLREIVCADASPQTPGEHYHRSASPENGLIQDVPRTAWAEVAARHSVGLCACGSPREMVDASSVVWTSHRS